MVREHDPYYLDKQILRESMRIDLTKLLSRRLGGEMWRYRLVAYLLIRVKRLV